MKTTITRVSIKSLSKFYAVIMGVTALLVVIPISIIAAFFSDEPTTSIILFLTIPIIYIIMGFVFGAFGAFTFNLTAKIIGGIEIETSPAKKRTKPPKEIHHDV